MALRQVPIAQLQLGMYVAKLDLPWFRSPFLRHSFLVETQSQITRLIKAGVRTVMIDPDQGLAVPGTFDTHNSRFTDSEDKRLDKESVHSQPPVKSLAQLHEEYTQAKLVQHKLDQAVQAVFSAITKTGTIRPEQAAEAVQEITIAAKTLPRSALFMALTQSRAGDAVLGRHALSTCTLALLLGQSFQFNPLELQQLATAALLHDIGLMQIPTELLRRIRVTSTPLSQEEQLKFHAHPRLSVQTLEQQGAFEPAVLQLIVHHHPSLPHYGLSAPAAPSSLSHATGILMTVDYFDELITGFGGASPLTTQQALQRIYMERQQNGIDSQILTRFISIIGIYPVHSYVKLNSKELGIVTALNAEKLHQPVVTITHNPDGAEYPSPLVVDLAHQEERTTPRAIESVLDGQPTASTPRAA